MTLFNPLLTPRLLLRPLRPEDAEDVFEYRALREVYQYQNFHPQNVAETLAFIQGNAEEPDIPGTWFQLGIRTRDKDRLVGDLGICFMMDPAQIEIGFSLRPDEQKKGYGLEAARAVVHTLFTRMNKHRIMASVDPRNEASIALLLKLGMRKEAHFKKSYRLEDGWGDDCIYAILREEWKE